MESCEFLTASAAADAPAAGELTSEELVETLLARIERLEPRLDTFGDVYGDEARTSEPTRRAGNAAVRFHGMLIALKDIIDFVGVDMSGEQAA